MECSVVLCTAHVMRTCMSKIYGDDARSKMVLAMHRRTKAGCEYTASHSSRSDPGRQELYNEELRQQYGEVGSVCPPAFASPPQSHHYQRRRIIPQRAQIHDIPLSWFDWRVYDDFQLDKKKSQDGRRAELQFRTRKLSVAAVDDAHPR